MTIEASVARDIVEHITGGWRAQAVYTAVKLGLPDLVEAGTTTSPALAAATGAEPEGIRRLMRLLVAMEVFAGSESGGYRTTALSGALLEGPTSLRDMVLLHGEEFYTAWGQAHHAVTRVSSGFEQAFGTTFYSYLGQQPETARRFQHTMNAGNMFFHAVPSAYDFAGKRVIDVGAGGGHLMTALLGAVPDARGVVFDRPHMVPEARAHVSSALGADGLARAEFVGGDMFEEVPAGGDVYLLCRVLAGWDADAVVRVFDNCRRALSGPSARVLVVDRLVDDESATVLPALWDLHLLMTNGGRHRSREEFTALLARAGFEVEQAIDLPMDNTALVARVRD